MEIVRRLATAGLALASLLLPLAGAPGRDQDLDRFIQDQMQRAHVPGLQACIVKHGTAVWAGAYGLADLERQVPVTKHTLFMLASVSKTVTGTALMQLVDAGLLDLDDGVNRYLPAFAAVENPSHPAVPITFRELLAHSSSIQDNWDVIEGYYVPGDSPVPLDRYLGNYLLPFGRNYDAGRNFYPWAPGTQTRYSNIGFALVGGMVERVGGVPCDRWCEQHIFQPLGMQETAWFLRDLDPARVALPYEFNHRTRRYHTDGHYGYPDYPDGQLRSSALQLARFLVAHIQDGVFQGSRVLSRAAVLEMRRPQYPSDPTQGLAFYHWDHEGEDRIGHSGGDTGASTEMWYRLSDGAGVIVLANGGAWLPWEEAAITRIVNRLFEEAGGY